MRCTYIGGMFRHYPSTHPSFFKCTVFFSLLILGCSQKNEWVVGPPLSYEFRKSIDRIASAWYPKTLDFEYGGFHSYYNAQWNRIDNPQKMIVTQARHVWSLSTLYRFSGDTSFLEYASHGVQFLTETMWDTEFGGFHTTAWPDSITGYRFSKEKMTYGNAFSVYALAAYFEVSQDSAALASAIDTYKWIETNSRDAEFDGYFNRLNRDGSWIWQNEGFESAPDQEPAWKDMNTTIHLLEAYSELYKVWPDTQLKTRMVAILNLLKSRIYDGKPYMTLFLTQDWSPVRFRDSVKNDFDKYMYYDHVSFGHDVETAFLMLEAAHVIGHHDEGLTQYCKQIVDHALENGWDKTNGGFYDYGYYFSKDSCTIIRPDKVWWTQAEGLNALLLMHKVLNEPIYWDRFIDQWKYINAYVIDPATGTWYPDGTDAKPETIRSLKGQIWKGNYHNLRALVNCHDMLTGQFELAQH